LGLSARIYQQGVPPFKVKLGGGNGTYVASDFVYNAALYERETEGFKCSVARNELLEIGREFDLDVTTNMRLAELLDAVAGSKKARLDRVLANVSHDTLKAMCFQIGVSQEGREKEILRHRILAKNRGEEPDTVVALGAADSARGAVASKPGPGQTAGRENSSGANGEVPLPKPVGKGLGEVAATTTSGVQQPLLPWEGFPVLDRASGGSPSAAAYARCTRP